MQNNIHLKCNYLNVKQNVQQQLEAEMHHGATTNNRV